MRGNPRRGEARLLRLAGRQRCLLSRTRSRIYRPPPRRTSYLQRDREATRHKGGPSASGTQPYRRMTRARVPHRTALPGCSSRRTYSTARVTIRSNPSSTTPAKLTLSEIGCCLQWRRNHQKSLFGTDAGLRHGDATHMDDTVRYLGSGVACIDPNATELNAWKAAKYNKRFVPVELVLIVRVQIGSRRT